MSRNDNGDQFRIVMRVTSREGRVSRNRIGTTLVGVQRVTSREGRVSRNNDSAHVATNLDAVTSREGRVSRNTDCNSQRCSCSVTSREGRVSRNRFMAVIELPDNGHVPRGTCE